jgi:two-component system NtrC family sensor kinase
VRKPAHRGERREQVEPQERLASVGAFAAGVAHDLNNPLAYLVTNIDYALSELTRLQALDAAAPGAAERARVEAEVLAALRDASEGAARLRAIVADVRARGRPARQGEGPAVAPAPATGERRRA